MHRATVGHGGGHILHSPRGHFGHGSHLALAR
jgi:hypothetical protein